jgi:hypothetical protein
VLLETNIIPKDTKV